MVAEQQRQAQPAAAPTRRAAAQPPVYRAASAAVAVPERRTVSPLSVPAARANRRRMAQRGPRVVRRAQELGWRSPMTAAVLATTLLVSLLCCYVYAYARLTAAGFELSRLTRDLRDAEREEAALHAQVSNLSLAASIEQRARGLGMEPAPPGEARVLTAGPGGVTGPAATASAAGDPAIGVQAAAR